MVLMMNLNENNAVTHVTDGFVIGVTRACARERLKRKPRHWASLPALE